MPDKNNCAPRPPMGWNSWDCYGAAVNEEQLLGNAEYMRDYLKDYGWEYVVCDIQWSEPTAVGYAYNNFAQLYMDEYSRLIPSPERFPSSADGKGFKPIADKIHAMGLKFGIHIMRGIPRQAVHRNTAIKCEGVTARDIAQQYSICPWNTDMYGIEYGRKGAQEYYDSIFQLYASWDVDYVKVDDIANTEHFPNNPYSAAKEIEMIRKAIDNCGREMVLSLSPGPAPVANAGHLCRNANMWRMTGDFWDRWDALKKMFYKCDEWYAWRAPGCWPDCDMLPLGRIQLTETDPKYKDRVTRFTKDEQKTMMALWCLFRSPLMIGAEMRLNDEFTLSLLTNRDLLDYNRFGEGAVPVRFNDKEAIWAGKDADGNTVVGLFNISEEEKEITVSLADLGLLAKKVYEATDLFTKEKSVLGADVTAVLAPHACCVLRIQ
ncbi:MAG: glycoside hydrolase family 27 protein [Clostridia bacterium]|nr:glycoside hydrolase family 27 protein [Clostridia bacterium]MBR3953917.1 glycoside hydrolase family 27 protein [Clostridia bacterium]